MASGLYNGLNERGQSIPEVEYDSSTLGANADLDVFLACLLIDQSARRSVWYVLRADRISDHALLRAQRTQSANGYSTERSLKLRPDPYIWLAPGYTKLVLAIPEEHGEIAFEIQHLFGKQIP